MVVMLQTILVLMAEELRTQRDRPSVSSDEENVKRKCDYFQFKLKFSIFGAIIPFKSGEDVPFPILARLV